LIQKLRNLDDAIEYEKFSVMKKETATESTALKLRQVAMESFARRMAPISALFETEIRLDERKAGLATVIPGGPAFIKQNGELYLFGVTSRGSSLCNEIGVYPMPYIISIGSMDDQNSKIIIYTTYPFNQDVGKGYALKSSRLQIESPT